MDDKNEKLTGWLGQLEKFEQALEKQVSQAEAPVLGLLGDLIPTEARTAIEKDLKVTPSIRGFAQRMDQFPALFGVWLSEKVMLELGQSGDYSIYPLVKDALGLHHEIGLSERELLWRAFRRGLFKLGIQPLPRLSGTHYMVAEYIRQAGVPIAFADDLAVKMLALAKRVGIPDEEDQDNLVAWQQSLVSKLSGGFSQTARAAVERDTSAYYTRTFLRVYLNDGQVTSADPLESAFARAFHSDGRGSKIARASIPTLLYRDGVLGIQIPATTRQSGVVQVSYGEQSKVVDTSDIGQFVALPEGLWPSVTVERSDGERILFAKLWEDNKPNRMLVFSSDGRLCAHAQLAQINPVELPPGQYTALCRFEPTNTDTCFEVWPQPKLFELQFDLRPGDDWTLMNGPAKVTFVGQSTPTFDIEGTSRESLERTTIRYGEVSARIQIPKDWLDAGQQSFQIRLTSGTTTTLTPITLQPDGSATVELKALIEVLRPEAGLWRVAAELVRAGDHRAIHRKTFLYWRGLNAISQELQFSYAVRPTNLVHSSVVGMTFGEACALPAERQGKLIRFSFDMGAGRVTSLSWNRPGLHIEVQETDIHGNLTTTPRQLGSHEAVSQTSSKRIIISGTDAGYVVLGEMRTYVDFSKRATRVFPASLLASKIEPGTRTLHFQSMVGGIQTPLLVLSQPHTVSKVHTDRLANLFQVHLTLADEPTEISISGRELTSGKEIKVEHKLCAGEWGTNELARMQTFTAPMGSAHCVQILIDVETLKPGIWTLSFGANIDGIWGRLEDSKEGRIGVAIAVNPIGKAIAGTEVIEQIDNLDLKTQAARLSRLSDHFRHLWSSLCWEQQGWLNSYYGELIKRLRDHEDECITTLTDIVTSDPIDTPRQGFFPKQSVGGSLNRIFALPRSSYRKVNERRHPIAIALKAIADLKGPWNRTFETILDCVPVMAFRNLTEVAKGMRPKDFRLDRLQQALNISPLDHIYELEDELYLTEPGQLLGGRHLAHAWIDMSRRYKRSMLMSNQRMACANSVARHIQQSLPTFGQDAPEGVRGASLVLRLKAFESLHILDDELTADALDRIALSCAWLAWYCRLEARQEGALQTFHTKLRQLRSRVEIEGPTVSDCLAYYLHVAPVLFGYYLLLWELVLTIELDPVVQNV